MKIIFTICSNNYLAQAKALGDSLAKSNPEYKFFIGLVDTKSAGIDYEKEIGYSIILASEIGIQDFDSLWKKYDIIELNTCVKPFYLEFFTNNFDELTHLMYFDPDTFLFGDLSKIEDELYGKNEIILTPHILSKIPIDGKTPSESIFLNYGIYNLGFIGIKNPKNNLAFFKWWGERTYKIGFNKVSEGLFVDQLWMNFTPLYYQNVIISRNLGLNMAPWNLHERVLSYNQNQKLIVNNCDELVFYHFSNYKYNTPEILATYYNRFNFSNRNDLSEIYEDYLKILTDNNIAKFSNVKCEYVLLRNELLVAEKTQQQNLQKKTLKRKIKDKLIQLLNK